MNDLTDFLRHIADLVGGEAIECEVGTETVLRNFLPGSVTLTYSYGEFTCGHGCVETLVFVGPAWRAEVSVWFEYSRLCERIETATEFNIDGDASLIEPWLDRVYDEVVAAA